MTTTVRATPAALAASTTCRTIGRPGTRPGRVVVWRPDVTTIALPARGRNWTGGAGRGLAPPERAGTGRERDFAGGRRGERDGERRAARARTRRGRGRLEAPLLLPGRPCPLKARSARTARFGLFPFDRRGRCALRPPFLRLVLITCRRRLGDSDYNSSGW